MNLKHKSKMYPIEILRKGNNFLWGRDLEDTDMKKGKKKKPFLSFVFKTLKLLFFIEKCKIVIGEE